MGLRGLGLPSRDSTGIDAVPDTGNDSSNDELLQVIRGGHNRSSDGHYGTSRHNRSTSAKRVADEDTDNSSEETSQVVGSDSDSLVRLALRFLAGGNIVLQGVNAGEVFGERR